MFGIFGKKNQTPTTNSVNAAVDPIKDEVSSINGGHSKVVLDKAKMGLDSHIVSLKKEKNIDLSAHRARVVVVLDRSYSMVNLFDNGSVQDTLTRLLPLALRFDDDGSLESFVFNTSYQELTPMTIKNFDGYVKKCIMKKGYGPSGGTSYAPVINAVVKKYNDGSKLPTFVIFITDGANDDERATDNAIRESSKHNIFFQFVGIGSSHFRYLEELDDLSDRPVDNTGFIKVQDFGSLNDEQLFQKLLDQYPAWLRSMHLM